MSVGSLLALALGAGDAHADPPAAAGAPRPTFRLEYRLLDATSQNNCPLESVTRSLLNRMFGYEAIDDKAGPGIIIDVASSRKPAYFEALAYLTRDDKLPIVIQKFNRASTADGACFRVVEQSVVAVWGISSLYLDQLKGPSEPEPEKPVTVTPLVQHAIPDAPPRPAAPLPPPPPPPQVTVQLPTPIWKRPQGFMMALGVISSVGLTPTPSLGGLAGLYFRRGDWSGGLEGRVEHGLVPAYLHELPVDSVYAGAALLAPCVHEGIFSGCFVLEGGGYSFSMQKQSSYLYGKFTMLGLGLRANLEHRVGEHFLLRGFVQASAMPLTPSIDWSEDKFHLWNAGPAFGTLGLTFISIP